MPRSLIFSHFCNALPSASSDRLYENQESHLFIDDGFYLHLTEDTIDETKWTLFGLMTLARVAVILGRWAWRRLRRINDCMSVHLPTHWQISGREGVQLFKAPLLEWRSPNFTLCKVLLLTQRLILGRMPIASIFLIHRRWHTGSKAFEKSRYTTSTGQLCLWLTLRLWSGSLSPWESE